jgi:hypothetical protein
LQLLHAAIIFVTGSSNPISDGAPMRINRDDLFERVWQEPRRTLAPNFGVSDVALRKARL